MLLEVVSDPTGKGSVLQGHPPHFRPSPPVTCTLTVCLCIQGSHGPLLGFDRFRERLAEPGRACCALGHWFRIKGCRSEQPDGRDAL